MKVMKILMSRVEAGSRLVCDGFYADDTTDTTRENRDPSPSSAIMPIFFFSGHDSTTDAAEHS